ncbi:MAG: hypothetical protein ACPLRP_02525 [Candidatus Bipolaricaulaceae bacterium]
MGESQVERPVVPFVLSLLAGLWMVLAGGMMSGIGWGPGGTGWMWGHGMMGGFYPGAYWPWLGIALGAVVLLGAAMLFVRPEQAQGWGIAVLVASAVNLFLGMGGVFASLLGIIGGALALRPGKNNSRG